MLPLKAYNAKIFVGTEVNYNEEIAPTDWDYIRSCIDYIGYSGMDGAVLSWDIMTTPRETVDRIIAHVKAF